MKKLLTLIAVLFLTTPAYAQETINVNVKKDDSYSDAVKAGAAATTARAALATAMAEPSIKIKVPIDVDFNNYTHIALVGVDYFTVMWGIKNTKAAYTNVKELLSFSPLEIINPAEEDKKKFKKNKMFLRSIKDPNWLYVYYKDSFQSVDKVTSLVIRDSKNKILYSATHTNFSGTEVMSVLTDFWTNTMKKLLIILLIVPLVLFSQSWEIGTGLNSGNSKIQSSQVIMFERTSYTKEKSIYSLGFEIGFPISSPLFSENDSFWRDRLTDVPGELRGSFKKDLKTGKQIYNPYFFGVKYKRYFKKSLSFSIVLGTNNVDILNQYIHYDLYNQEEVLDQLYDDPTLGFRDLSENDQEELEAQNYKYDESYENWDSDLDKIIPYYKIGLDYNFSFPISLKIGYGSNGFFTGISYVTKNQNLIKNLTKIDKESESKNIKIAGTRLSNVDVYDLSAMIKIFIADCRVNGIDVLPNNIKATFDELPEGTVALASGFNNDNQIIIKVDPVKWQNASPSKQWYVLYHELGHDVLNLDHGEGGKMMFNYVDRDYSWDEWLNDKNYMFNSYKRNN